MAINIKFICWEVISPKLFKVVVERQQSTDVPTIGDFQEGVEAVLGFGFKVRDNISEITSSSGRCYDRLILELVHEEVEAEDTEAIANFGKISANVYRNKGDDSLWTVTKADDGSERLVRNDTIDGEEVLRSLVLTATTEELDDFIDPEVYAGDYASFVDEEGDVKEGFVANDDEAEEQYVIDENLDEHEITTAAQYLDVVPSNSEVFVNANFDESDAMEQIKKFYGDADLMTNVKKYINKNVLTDKEAAAAAALTKVATTPVEGSVDDAPADEEPVDEAPEADAACDKE